MASAVRLWSTTYPTNCGCSGCTTQGVFAEAGPLDIFVSRHYIPPEYEFRADDASWASTETGVVIRAGAEMRVKVLGANATGAVAAIGTINEPHLGPQ